MEPFQLFIVIMLLVVIAQVSYLIAKSSTRTMTRKHSRQILLDTSVLIDGRIVPIARTGFIGGTLVIPRSVIGELQFMADAADHDKRARARFGLDVAAELQSIPDVDVVILQDGSKADEGVDERLLTLAKQHGAVVCTLDYNLNKVALVEEITILNINELAQSVRMAYLPGEKIMLELVQKGQDAHQAVGYLPDGTMVVVEHASRSMGQAVEVEIVRSLQTAAGRMMFAKPVHAKDAPKATKRQTSQQKPSSSKNSTRKSTSKPAGRAPQQRKKRTGEDPESKLINLVKNS